MFTLNQLKRHGIILEWRPRILPWNFDLISSESNLFRALESDTRSLSLNLWIISYAWYSVNVSYSPIFVVFLAGFSSFSLVFVVPVAGVAVVVDGAVFVVVCEIVRWHNGIARTWLITLRFGDIWFGTCAMHFVTVNCCLNKFRATNIFTKNRPFSAFLSLFISYGVPKSTRKCYQANSLIRNEVQFAPQPNQAIKPHWIGFRWFILIYSMDIPFSVACVILFYKQK